MALLRSFIPVVLLTALAGPLAAHDFAGFLRAQNGRIAGDRGPLQLRGVNLGNWLFLEGYLFAAQGLKQKRHSDFLASLTDLLGSDLKKDDFLHRWRASFITRSDIDRIAGLGFNSVRVPLHRDLFIDPKTGAHRDEGFYWLDRLLDWCRPHGIYVIPDLHAAPGGQNRGHVSDSTGEAGLWTNYEPNLAATQKLWMRIAGRYAHEPLIGGWDLLNEPELTADGWKLRDAQMNITEAIRQVDKNHLIIWVGNWFATSFWELFPDPWNPSPLDLWDENLALSFHTYWSPVPHPGFADQLRMAQAAGLPLWLGEFGENSNPWLAGTVAEMEARGIGWSFWCWKK